MVKKIIRKLNCLSEKATNLYSPTKNNYDYIELYKEKKEILKVTMWNPKEKNMDIKYLNRINEINHNLRMLNLK